MAITDGATPSGLLCYFLECTWHLVSPLILMMNEGCMMEDLLPLTLLFSLQESPTLHH